MKTLNFRGVSFSGPKINGLHFSSTTIISNTTVGFRKQFHQIKGLRRFHISRYNHIHQLKPFGVTSFLILQQLGKQSNNPLQSEIHCCILKINKGRHFSKSFEDKQSVVSYRNNIFVRTFHCWKLKLHVCF